ncbi:LysE family translocator [Sulfurospirillum sp.]|uniref:LysE family translocator n=1 Tax=Sulfurospirillum sp. TaxID=2053622 RepID=UPI002FDEE1AA
MPLDLWTFLIAITLLTMTPGADTMIVIRNTLRGGAKDGLVSSFGICLGLFVHATLSAVGISAILLYSATAFMLLKTVGALYLLWLGFNSLKSFWNAKGIHQTHVVPKPFRFLVSLQEGFLSNVLNPKAVIFYMAFLPQFISHEHSALAQSLFLALIHFIIAMIWLGLLIYTLISANSFITKRSVRQSLDAISGIVMIGLGIRLFLEKR